MRVVIELLNYFHDYMMMLLIVIMVFVSYVFGWIRFSSRLDRYTMDSHVLETVWTVVPMVILCFIAFPSLFLLYMMEDCRGASLTVKVVGHQ
jgi:heme/copper-type cytochrome/quinol oxidase subunit 2